MASLVKVGLARWCQIVIGPFNATTGANQILLLVIAKLVSVRVAPPQSIFLNLSWHLI